MADKDPDYTSLIEVVKVPTVSLLVFPPQSRAPSGFYLLEPDGAGGNKLTLLAAEEFDPRTARGWIRGENERVQRLRRQLADPGGAVCQALAKGATWSTLPAETLVQVVPPPSGSPTTGG